MSNYVAEKQQLANTSPSAIEEILVSKVKDEVGQWRDVVKIRPFLEVQDEDTSPDVSVKNGYGAVRLDVYGQKIYLPFMIVDKVLMPFDTIRMGEEEVAYDLSKLQKIINGIEQKAKAKESSSGDAEIDEFDTMELADMKDLQFNNGFLGTIMNIRDNHRSKDLHGNSPWTGQGFGMMEDARMLKHASKTQDAFELYHDTMEKLAKVKVYTKEQLNDFVDAIEKEAAAEMDEGLEKEASSRNVTLDEARLKRDTMKLEDQKMANVHRAHSGNNVEFPVFGSDRFELKKGRYYRNLKGWLKQSNRTNSFKTSAIVLDNNGGYLYLKSNDPLMMTLRDPGDVNLPTVEGRSLAVGGLYTIESSQTDLMHPFRVKMSFHDEILNDGIVLSVRERSLNDPEPDRRTNTLFKEVFDCEDTVSGKFKDSNGFTSEPVFTAIVVNEPDFEGPTFLSKKELYDLIERNAEDGSDLFKAKDMITRFGSFSDDGTFVLIGPHQKFFKMTKKIEGYYTKPDEVVKETFLKKQAADFSQNKARLELEDSREPKSYAIKWQFLKEQQVGGSKSSSLERREKRGMSEEEAKSFLKRLGFDYTEQGRFFEIIQRTGTHAVFQLPDPELASRVSDKDMMHTKVKEKVRNVGKGLLHSNNFTSVLENAVADEASELIINFAPGAIDKVHSISDTFGIKHAEETASSIEKMAQRIGKKEWHELSSLTNLKYHIDKVAETMDDGAALYGFDQVIDNLIEHKPFIEKKAKELIEFNREQRKHYKHDLVPGKLIKQASDQLDGLYNYATALELGKKKV